MSSPLKNLKYAISPTRAENYPDWYQEVIKAGQLAENSEVRGCMVIKPWGYAIWENMQQILDKSFKQTGHVNAYFPLFIPIKYLEKEAAHVEGFAKECAVVTHTRLEYIDGHLQPAAKLEEPLVIRPTSETIIGECYSRWVQSYRDLPILINQWANVVRWEMRTRLFLRTTEFLWQEGHTAHETSSEALDETIKMLDVYANFAEQTMALPVIKGIKTADERFPGADETFTIEAMMQDKKALQAGTSHFLGQNFARASNIKFTTRQGDTEYAWTTSWGVSTRLIGGLIMAHSDDDGVILPPKLSPVHVIIIPIIKDSGTSGVLEYCQQILLALEEELYHSSPIRVSIDNRELNSGNRGWDAIKKGIPLRLEIGERDLQNNAVTLARRDLDPRKKISINKDEFIKNAANLLEEIQQHLFDRAYQFRKNNTKEITNKIDFINYFQESENNLNHGGFAIAFSDVNNPEISDLLKSLKVTARCIPLNTAESRGNCIFTSKKDCQKIIYAKAY